MDFEKLSAERYSLRKFDTRPVEQEKLDLILEAGRNAPTAHNKQPQRIFVFRSPEALEKADACMDCHFHAPVVIGVGYDPKESWHREHDGKDHGEIDAAIAVTQMMLQAADLGLGTTYVGMFRCEGRHLDREGTVLVGHGSIASISKCLDLHTAKGNDFLLHQP